MWLFLYGTLLDPGTLARRAGDRRLPRALRPASLAGFRRVAFRGTPYPTLRPWPGGMVAGALVRVPPAALDALRRYEGPCYRLRPVRVGTARGPRLARAWVVARRWAGAVDWTPPRALPAGRSGRRRGRVRA